MADYADIDNLILIYQDEMGLLYEQPASDITTSGTLIDPETGEDMELVGYYISK